MKWLVLALVPLQLFADGLLGGSRVERIISDGVVTNRAWRRDVVTVKNGELDDPTGTLVSKADIAYLSAVESGITQIYQAGSNGFARAAADFRTAVSNHPPGNATMIAAVFKPYTTARPGDRSPYMFLVSEDTKVGTTNELHWFFSKGFTQIPRVVVQDVYLNNAGNVTTNYSEMTFVDYLNDATNTVAGGAAPHTEGEWDRIIRAYDPPSPVANALVYRDHHMKFGHPENGFTPGTLNIEVSNAVTHVHGFGITGTYTDHVNHVEFQFDKGAFKKVKAYTP